MERYDTIPSTSGNDATQSQSFTVWIILAQLLGLASVVMVAVWMGHYHGGFAWQENPPVQFNYHPLFMVIGMVFLYANAILVYRVFRNTKKIYVKVIHTSLHVMALVFAGVGLKAVFDSHNLNPKGPVANLYSLHSWLGLTTIILFSLQWLCGLVTFLVPGLPNDIRGLYKPMHVFWGMAVFLMAVATSLAGITEKLLFNLTEYSKHSEEGVLANILGLILVAMALVVSYIVTNANFKREPLAEDEIQLNQ